MAEREEHLARCITPKQWMDMIGKMTLESHFKKTGMIGMITPKSFSELLGILGDKEKCIKSDEFIYSKKNRIGISVLMQDTFRLRQESQVIYLLT